MFHNSIAKISEKLNKRNLLKLCPQVTYPTYFYTMLHSFLPWEKVKLFDFFFKSMTRIKHFCIDSYDKWFCFKSWQKFANLRLLCKAPRKKRLSGRCRKHSSRLDVKNHSFRSNLQIDNEIYDIVLLQAFKRINTTVLSDCKSWYIFVRVYFLLYILPLTVVF